MDPIKIGCHPKKRLEKKRAILKPTIGRRCFICFDGIWVYACVIQKVVDVKAFLKSDNLVTVIIFDGRIATVHLDEIGRDPHHAAANRVTYETLKTCFNG